MRAAAVLGFSLELVEQLGAESRATSVLAYPSHADSRGHPPRPTAHAGGEMPSSSSI